jgi:hypothetical protein
MESVDVLRTGFVVEDGKKRRINEEELAAVKASDDPNCTCGAPKHEHGFDPTKGGGYGEHLGDFPNGCKAFTKADAPVVAK